MPYSGWFYASGAGGVGGNGTSDNGISVSESGDVYFYSPEQLDGDHGFEGLQNLYLYRGGSVRYVTTLTPLTNTAPGAALMKDTAPAARLRASRSPQTAREWPSPPGSS